MPGVTDTMPPNEMVAALFVVANVRLPDLSRSTFEELINSGQIELIQSQEVRRALATYDRAVNEVAAGWNFVDPELWHWVSSRIPHRIHGAFEAECVATEDGMYGFQTVCPFDIGDWPASSLRMELKSEDAQQRLTRAEYNYKAHEFFVAILTDEARVLEAALTGAESRR